MKKKETPTNDRFEEQDPDSAFTVVKHKNRSDKHIALVESDGGIVFEKEMHDAGAEMKKEITDSLELISRSLGCLAVLVEKGDLPGHPFRGNQWGQGGMMAPDRDSGSGVAQDKPATRKPVSKPVRASAFKVGDQVEFTQEYNPDGTGDMAMLNGRTGKVRTSAYSHSRREGIVRVQLDQPVMIDGRTEWIITVHDTGGIEGLRKR